MLPLANHGAQADTARQLGGLPGPPRHPGLPNASLRLPAPLPRPRPLPPRSFPESPPAAAQPAARCPAAPEEAALPQSPRPAAGCRSHPRCLGLQQGRAHTQLGCQVVQDECRKAESSQPSASSLPMPRTCDHRQQRCRVRHALRHGPHAVQGRGIGYKPVAGDPAIGGLDPHNAAEGGGLPDAAAGVAAQRRHALVGCHG